MAITPGYDTVKESQEIEQHYIDKGAVKTHRQIQHQMRSTQQAKHKLLQPTRLNGLLSKDSNKWL